MDCNVLFNQSCKCSHQSIHSFISLCVSLYLGDPFGHNVFSKVNPSRLRDFLYIADKLSVREWQTTTPLLIYNITADDTHWRHLIFEEWGNLLPPHCLQENKRWNATPLCSWLWLVSSFDCKKTGKKQVFNFGGVPVWLCELCPQSKPRETARVQINKFSNLDLCLHDRHFWAC